MHTNERGNPPIILLVEDDEFFRVPLAHVMTEAGFTVVQAVDGMEGLQFLAEGLRPDLIILDIIMPNKNGFDFLVEQSQNPHHATIPVIIYSNLSQTSDHEKVMKLGVHEVMIKTQVSMHDALDRIVNFFEQAL